MSRTIIEVQQDFARNSAYGANIFWDSLTAEEADILKEKIRILLPANSNAHNEVFNNVWQQRKYTNRLLLSAIIYVMVTKDQEGFEPPTSYTNFTCHPVIRTRKCLNDDNSAGCCMVFIDEHGRIYKNWQHYVQSNRLPKGIMVAPANGIYSLNHNDEVELELHLTPAANSKLLSATDKWLNIGSLMAVAPLAASIVFPVAAPIMLAAETMTITAGAYSAVRSGFKLTDRYQHGQTTSIKNSEARDGWLGVASGVVGLGAVGASNVLKYASSNGKSVTNAVRIVKGISITSAVLSSADFANNVYGIFLREDGEISTDLLRLASSLLVLTNSINNMALVADIRKKSIRRALFKQNRRILKTIATQSTSTSRPNSSRMDFMRITNNIPTSENLHQHINGISMGIPIAITAATAARNAASTTFLPLFDTHNVDVIEMVTQFSKTLRDHILDGESLTNVIKAMANRLCVRGIQLLMNLTRTFLKAFVGEINQRLRTAVSTEAVLFRMFLYCMQTYEHLAYDYLEEKQAEILAYIENYFSSITPVNEADRQYKCKLCNGYYYQCAL